MSRCLDVSMWARFLWAVSLTPFKSCAIMHAVLFSNPMFQGTALGSQSLYQVQRLRMDRNPYPNPVHNASLPELKFHIQPIIHTDFQIHTITKSIWICQKYLNNNNFYPNSHNSWDHINVYRCFYLAILFECLQILLFEFYGCVKLIGYIIC